MWVGGNYYKVMGLKVYLTGRVELLPNAHVSLGSISIKGEKKVKFIIKLNSLMKNNSTV